MVEVVFDSMSTFAQVYRDPGEFGLDERLVARLLPDSDLEALPRRAFIFPVLEGRHGGVDLSKLDPANPSRPPAAAGRRPRHPDRQPELGRGGQAHRPAPGDR